MSDVEAIEQVSDIDNDEKENNPNDDATSQQNNDESSQGDDNETDQAEHLLNGTKDLLLDFMNKMEMSYIDFSNLSLSQDEELKTSRENAHNQCFGNMMGYLRSRSFKREENNSNSICIKDDGKSS